MSVCSIILGHDAFRRKGLGKSCWDIFTTMSNYWNLKNTEIAELTGRDVTTVRACLKKMSNIINPITNEKYFLVYKNEDGIYDLHEDYKCEIWTYLDCIAEALGSKGLGQEQKDRHERDRDNSIFEFRRKK